MQMMYVDCMYLSMQLAVQMMLAPTPGPPTFTFQVLGFQACHHVHWADEVRVQYRGGMVHAYGLQSHLPRARLVDKIQDAQVQPLYRLKKATVSWNSSTSGLSIVLFSKSDKCQLSRLKKYLPLARGKPKLWEFLSQRVGTSMCLGIHKEVKVGHAINGKLFFSI